MCPIVTVSLVLGIHVILVEVRLIYSSSLLTSRMFNILN